MKSPPALNAPIISVSKFLAIRVSCLTSEQTNRSTVLIFAILGLAALLRFYQIGTESVWIDEMLSLRDAEAFEWTIPYRRPLYYAILQFWMRLGQSDAWLRTLSVLFGTASIFLTYRLGKLLISQSVGYTAAFLMAIAPIFIHHSQEIRMYSLIPCLSLAGTLALVRLMQQPNYKQWGWWLLMRSGLILSNPNNFLILMADAALTGWKFRRQRRWLIVFGVGFAVLGLLLAPILFSLTVGGGIDDFVEEQSVDDESISLLHTASILTQLTMYWPLRYLLESSKSAMDNWSAVTQLVQSHLPILLLCGVATLMIWGLLFVGIAAIVRHPTGSLVWLATWAGLPSLFMFIVSCLHVVVWSPRYLMFVAPYLLLLVAMGFMVMWHWRRPVAIAIAIIYLFVTSSSLRDYYTTLYRNDWRGAAAYIEQNEQAGDVIDYYSIPALANQSFFRYYNGPIPAHLIERVDTKDGFSQIDPQSIQASLQESQAPPDTVWLTCWIFCKDEEGINQILEQTLGSNFVIAEHQIFTSQEFEPIEVYRATAK